jgi:hypothetical protein
MPPDRGAAVTGGGPASPVLTRTSHRLTPDPSRTLSRLFVPGHETLIRGESRATAVMARILRMSEDEVDQTLARTLSRYADRYRDLRETLERHFRLVAHRLGDETNVSTARQHLIGAYFTQEYALEAAALFNPSIVPHPDQARCGRGELRFIMSLRAVGEGHVSSIEFRTGTISNDGAITIDEPGRFLDTGHIRPVAYDREFFKKKLAEVSHDDESAQLLWSLLPSRFSMAELDRAVSELSLQQETRTGSLALIDWVRWIAASNYEVEFDERLDLSERVLWPTGPDESHGMEDARFSMGPGEQLHRILRRPASLGAAHHHPGARTPVGANPARQLWLTDRDTRGMAGLHPRRRAHAGVRHWRHASRPRQPGAPGIGVARALAHGR